MKAAVVLVSGGLDSATCLAVARAEGFELHALSFDYGQRHRVELERAKILTSAVGAAQHQIIHLDPKAFRDSALTDDIKVPKDGVASGIPVTYVPARNTIFLAYALGLAETTGAGHIYIGVNAVDYSGYPDCRPEFINAFQSVANLATKAAVEGSPVTIHAPLMSLTKKEIIQRGIQLGVDYALTSSCYDPSSTGAPCLLCDSCRIRIAAFRELGLEDPLLQLAGT